MKLENFFSLKWMGGLVLISALIAGCSGGGDSSGSSSGGGGTFIGTSPA